MSDRVHFAGRVNDVVKRSLMERAWLHAITSMKEGWGITVLEAAACGTPTVASDMPGLRDAVVHGETGLLVRHGDVTALADAIRTLLSDKAQLQRLAAGARARAESFTWDAAAAAIGRHLTSVAARERPALAGAWARFRSLPPLATIGLPRTGTGIAPFGAASWIVDAVGSDGAATARVSIGAFGLERASRRRDRSGASATVGREIPRGHGESTARDRAARVAARSRTVPARNDGRRCRLAAGGDGHSPRGRAARADDVNRCGAR